MMPLQTAKNKKFPWQLRTITINAKEICIIAVNIYTKYDSDSNHNFKYIFRQALTYYSKMLRFQNDKK